MYKIVSFRYVSVIQKNFARLRRAQFFLPPPPNHKSVPTALLSTSRDISHQEMISCLHDQPRSCTFSTGDLLFVYTQYNENEQHILWFDIYNILYISLCDWQTKGMHLFKIKDTFYCYTVRYCVIHERKFMVQQVLSTVNGSEQKKSMHYFARAKRSVRGTYFDSQIIIIIQTYRLDVEPELHMSVRLYNKDSQYTGLTLHDF